jgi:hypothetical protein
MDEGDSTTSSAVPWVAEEAGDRAVPGIEAALMKLFPQISLERHPVELWAETGHRG